MITSMSKYPSAENTSAVHAFTGVYVVSAGTLENYDFNSFTDVIEDIVPQMISDGCEIYTYGTVDFWHKITDAQGFLECQKSILSGKTDIAFSAQQNDGGIYSNTVSNFSGVSIIPPVFIGKNAVIEAGTVIEPGSVIDDGAYIEKAVKDMRSIYRSGRLYIFKMRADALCDMCRRKAYALVKLRRKFSCRRKKSGRRGRKNT